IATNGRVASSPVTLLSAAVPGRLRVRVDGLRRSPAMAAQIVDRLGALDPVASTRANPVNGSVRVIFDMARFRATEPVVEFVRCRGDAMGPGETCIPAVGSGETRVSPMGSAVRPRARAATSAAPRDGQHPPVSTSRGVANRTPWHALDGDAVAARLGVL